MITRQYVLASFVAMLCGFMTIKTAAAEERVVTISQGALAGEAEDGVNVFKGIPYAQPPVGARRWKAPVAAESWDKVRTAADFGPSCTQPPLPPSSIYADEPEEMSEDCLSLNVWAPAGVSDAPVIVWIHGGALQRGSSASPMYDGSNFARRGVVFVSLNYRLGVFGWLAHPELSAASPHQVSGNYGLLDQIEALKWVRENIAAFGGNPDNVTIMGESAGALSVSYLLASPQAHGLFAKAIAESANIRAVPELKTPAHGLLSAEAFGALLASKVGADSLEALRAMDANTLALAAMKARFWAQGTVDGLVLPKQVVDTFDAGEQAQVPLLAGFNSGEVRSQAMFLPPIPATPDAYVAEITKRYHDLAPAFLAIYPPADMRESMLATLRDAIYGWAGERMVKQQAEAGFRSYLYIFDHCDAASAARDLCAFHASELPYVFGQIGVGADLPVNWPKPSGDADEALSQAMMNYWVSFARTGSPSSAGQAKWQPYGEAEAYMRFAHQPIASNDPVAGMFEMQEELVRRRRATGQQWFINVGLTATDVPKAR
ncbi:carboxylesterase/lipase family protein [Kordiimonas aestuarii]|uniref:carboxylesterase/lipase family protein n=1 Tax=Kordiimonas aestuarii TaxID=1005925 RepID=UPI0021D14C37|nr:carboxylesterase family protein [Kordiimonas aestuarii]